MKIVIESTRYIEPRTQREVTRYTPVFTPDATASGMLTFAFYEVWTDEAFGAHLSAQNKARENAIECFARFAHQSAIFTPPVQSNASL